jgi:LacI family transcriptional regulator
MPRRARVTLKDVSNECGYAINTISRAMRDDKKLPAATREKIRATAWRMGYIPNSLASTLRSGRSHIIAVIVNDVHNQHFCVMLSKMDEALRQAGYNIMILCMQLDEALGEQMIHTAISQSVDGILYFPYHNNRTHIDYMVKNRMPFVLLDRWIQGIVADCVRCDDEQGGYLAGRHLIGLGHRRFLFLSGVLASSSQLDRHRGFLRALAEAGVSADSVRVVPWEAVSEGMMNEHMGPLLEPLDYTAILSFSDEIAYHALNTLRQQGRAVPEDVSLISFDHIRSGIPYLPRLTSIYAAEGDVAQAGVRLLLNRLKHPDLPTQVEILPVAIYDEGTTAPPA